MLLDDWADVEPGSTWASRDDFDGLPLGLLTAPSTGLLAEDDRVVLGVAMEFESLDDLG